MTYEKHYLEIDMAERKPKNISEVLTIAKKIVNKRYQGIVSNIRINNNKASIYSYYGKITFYRLPLTTGNSDKINTIVDKILEVDSGILSETKFDFEDFSVIYSADNLLKVEPRSSEYKSAYLGSNSRKFIKRNGLSTTLDKEAKKRGLKTHNRKEIYGEQEIHYTGISGLIRKIIGKPEKIKVFKSVEMLCLVPRRISESDKMRFIQREISEYDPKYVRLNHNPYEIEIGHYDTSLSLPEYALNNGRVIELLNFLAKDKMEAILNSKWEVEFFIDTEVFYKTKDNFATRINSAPRVKPEEEIIAEELTKKGYDSGRGSKGVAEYCVLVK